MEKLSWTPMTTLNVTVAKGIADIWGTITNEDERHAIRVVVENTPGVTAVNDHMVYIEPYTGTVIEGRDATL
jgi:osmotically-inducible protein OsmY